MPLPCSTTSVIATEFADRVEEALTDSPYVVERIPSGFVLTLDLANPTWYGPFEKTGLTQLHRHVVAVKGDTFTITEESSTLTWHAGTPSTHFTATRRLGGSIEFGTTPTWEMGSDRVAFRVGKLAYSAGEAVELITLVGREMGLRKKRSTPEMIGICAALMVPVGFVLGLIVLVILMLTGVAPTPWE